MVPVSVVELTRLGFAPSPANVLLQLGARGEATSREVQEALGLSQPRVSEVLRRLEGDGWVRVGVEKRLRVGRPRHVYRLRRPLPEVVEELQRRAERARSTELAQLLRRVSGARRPAVRAARAPAG